MIRLVHLLPEQILFEISPAAQQAKKLGYTSAGFGNWRKGKDGPVVARTKDGKLVPIGGKKGGAKKAGRSTQEKRPPWMQEIEGLASKGGENSKAVLRQIQRLERGGIKIDRIVDTDIDDYTDKALHQPFAKSHNLTSISQRQNNKLSNRQNNVWRSQMTPDEIDQLNRNQRAWQEDSIYSNRAKKRVYREINELTRRYGTPNSGVSTVYRGISIPTRDNPTSFLSNFEVGKSVVSPPGGYTTDRSTALSFGYNREMGHIIIFNVKGGGKQVKGIHVASNYKSSGRNRSSKTERGDEQEVILPSTHSQKVSEVETVLVRLKTEEGEPFYRFVTNISTVQDSRPMKGKTIYEAKKPKNVTDKNVFVKYMGGSVRGENDKRHQELKNRE